MKQGGYLHKNIFDVLHLHQSEGRKHFIRYLKIIIKVGGKTIQVVKLCTENRIHDMMNKSTTENLKTTKNYIKLLDTKQLKSKTKYVNTFELKTTSKVVYTQTQRPKRKRNTNWYQINWNTPSKLIDGVFQLIWYQFVFRLRFDLCGFVLVYIHYTTLDVVFSSNLFTLFLTLLVFCNFM